MTGAGGQLGHDVVAHCTTAGDEVVGFDHAGLDGLYGVVSVKRSGSSSARSP